MDLTGLKYVTTTNSSLSDTNFNFDLLEKYYDQVVNLQKLKIIFT